MRPSYLLLLTTILPVMAQTQRFTFGVQGGVPAQTPLGSTKDHMPFVIGPTRTIRIFSRLSIETGVMFQRMGTEFGFGAFLYPENAVTLYDSTQRAHALEVPVLAKIHLLGNHRTWRPFVALGPTIRRTSLHSDYLSVIVSGASLSSLTAQSAFNRDLVRWNLDPAFGAGVDFKAGRFHLEPEVRYSYWGAGKDLPVRKNQVGFLLGFRF